MLHKQLATKALQPAAGESLASSQWAWLIFWAEFAAQQ